MPDTAALLATYDAQVRTSLSSFDPGSVLIDADGPLQRVSGGHRGFVNYPHLAGLRGAELDALIARTVAYFTSRGEAFEWKTYAHDEPADLTDRLAATGFVAEATETVLVGEAAAMIDRPALSSGSEAETVLVGEAAAMTDSPTVGLADPQDWARRPAFGFGIERVTDRAAFDRIGAMESEVWGEDWTWLADDLAQRSAQAPNELVVFEATADGRTVSAAWLVFDAGTDFAGLYGGSTLAAWRGRGIYRALVAARARLAVERGYRYLQVDASPDSTPILRRLGFTVLTHTTPYVFTP